MGGLRCGVGSSRWGRREHVLGPGLGENQGLGASHFQARWLEPRGFHFPLGPAL